MSDKVLHVTDKSFDLEVLKSDTPVLVDFWATWCAPCRAIAPIVEEMAETYSGKLKVAKMNVDDNPETSQSHDILSIPTLKIFKRGSIVENFVGLQSKDALLKALKSHAG